MRTAFILITALIGVVICYVLPFIAAVRGGGLLKIILFTWLGLIAYLVFLVAYVPQIVAGSDEEFCKEIQTHWVPEGPGIVAVVVIGWVNPLIAAAVGRALRSKSAKPPVVVEASSRQEGDID
jgi:hypothetical protein